MVWRRHYFTLLELTAVITILILLTAVSTAYISRDQKGSDFKRALQEFQLFCARARSASMADNVARKIVFYPQEEVFRIEKADAWNEGSSVIQAEEAEAGAEAYVVLEVIDPEEVEGDDSGGEDGQIRRKYLQWRFPENLEVKFDLPVFDGVEIQSEAVELWRYTRGGAARISCELIVQMNYDSFTFTVSELSGLLEVVVNREDEGRNVW